MTRIYRPPITLLIGLVVVVVVSVSNAFILPGSVGSDRSGYGRFVVVGRTADEKKIHVPSLPKKAMSHDVDKSRGHYQVSIEYCTGCKWGTRAFWMAQELLSTFEKDTALEAVTLLPSRPPAPGGQYIVRCSSCSTNNNNVIIWDRKEKEGFPEIKELKQLVRDQIDPDRYLGHSDRTDRQVEIESESGSITTTDEGSEWTSEKFDQETIVAPQVKHAVSPNIVIVYCIGCRWLLRGAYFGQELMSTFADEVNSLTLVPSRPPAKSATFQVFLDTELIWDRAGEGRFPESKELKQRIRDRLVPTKDLGHSDNKPKAETDVSEEEAAEARKFFGVQ